VEAVVVLLQAAVAVVAACVLHQVFLLQPVLLTQLQLVVEVLALQAQALKAHLDRTRCSLRLPPTVAAGVVQTPP
jgi:hypothetical protein